ncbi:hypothetical protein B0H14DRAFT_3173485 [Mycena olivaceomarginata]|nr:hypothetical protein B0H14DRAFT_3173485 [Mycena olivaceomarginata]
MCRVCCQTRYLPLSGMTATAICMRCGVFACVYPPLFLPPRHTTTSMPPTTTNHDCEGWGELDGDFGRMWWVWRSRTRYVRRVQPFHCQSHPQLSFTGVRGAATAACGCMRARGTIYTGVRFDREARYRRERLLFGALRLKIACGTWRWQDSCKMQASCAFFLFPSNTAAKDFFDPCMTEWVKEDGLVFVNPDFVAKPPKI